MILYNSAPATGGIRAEPPGHRQIYTCGPHGLTILPTSATCAAKSMVRTCWRSICAKRWLKRQRVMTSTDVGHLTSDADEGEDTNAHGARREHKSVM